MNDKPDCTCDEGGMRYPCALHDGWGGETHEPEPEFVTSIRVQHARANRSGETRSVCKVPGVVVVVGDSRRGDS